MSLWMAVDNIAAAQTNEGEFRCDTVYLGVNSAVTIILHSLLVPQPLASHF